MLLKWSHIWEVLYTLKSSDICFCVSQIVSLSYFTSSVKLPSSVCYIIMLRSICVIAIRIVLPKVDGYLMNSDDP